VDEKAVTELEKIETGISLIVKCSQLDEDCKMKFQNLLNQYSQFINEIEILKSESQKLKKQIYDRSHASIYVNKTTYPGTIISINQVKFAVDRQYFNKQFVLSEEGELVIV
jgi:hypothetical protein